MSWEASRIARRLQAGGNAIGDHDAWIAAFAVRHDRPLVTRNVVHFSRIAGLKILAY